MNRIARLAVLLAACSPAGSDYELPNSDPIAFEEEVYPILLRDCAFSGCHGDPRRFFRIYGPGRTRLDPETLPYAAATPEELAQSFDRARSMLLSPSGPRQAPLLRKPLAVSAGGSGHEGDAPGGAAIYASKEDPSYVTLFFWAIGDES